MKKSLIEAREAAQAASANFPGSVYLVVDAPGKRSKSVSAYMNAVSKVKGAWEIVAIYFGGKECSAVYKYRAYDAKKLVYSELSTDIAALVFWADLQSVPVGGYIEIIDYITGQRRYYRERD